MSPTLPPEIITHIFSLAEADEQAAGGGSVLAKSAFLSDISRLSSAWRSFALTKLVGELHFSMDGFNSHDAWFEPSARVFRLVQTMLSVGGLGGAVRRVTIEGTACDDEEALELLFLSCTNLTRVTFGRSEYRKLDVLQPCLTLSTLELVGVSCGHSSPVLSSLKSLIVTDSYFSPDLSPSSFPKLELLALLDNRDRSAHALAATPTLRALVLSTGDCPTLHPFPIETEDILWNLTDWGPMHKGRFSIPPLPMVHVRAWAGHQAGELANALEQGWDLFGRLETVYLKVWEGQERGWEGDDMRLREIGREKGFEVAHEPPAGEDRSELDYFPDSHGKALPAHE